MPSLNDVVATNVSSAGSINDKLIAYFSGVYRSSVAGSPEGVTDAPLGATYQDVATPATYLKTTAAGTLTGWVRINVPAIKLLKTGKWYFIPSGVASTIALADGSLKYIPKNLDIAGAIDRIGVEVTTNIASSVIRLGWYNDDGTNNPGSRIFDAGTVDSSTTGVKTITVAQTVPAGRSWPVAVAQGGAPTVRGTASNMNDDTLPALGQGDAFASILVRGSVAGALPDPASAASGDASGGPFIAIRGA